MHDREGVRWRLGTVTNDGSVANYVHPPNLNSALRNVNKRVWIESGRVLDGITSAPRSPPRRDRTASEVPPEVPRRSAAVLDSDPALNILGAPLLGGAVP
jgi:hypothetical protein